MSYYERHKAERIAYQKKRYREKQNQLNDYQKQRYQKKKSDLIKYQYDYWNKTNWNTYWQHEWRRKEGFAKNPIMLNKPFPQSNMHHINKEVVICIPRAINRAIPHSVLKDRNMNQINKYAFEYLFNSI